MRKRTDQEKILALLKKRSAGKTICPSEILPASEKKNPRRMAEVREAACGLVEEGKIEITQKGRVIEPSKIHGPIRLRLKDPP